MCDHEDQPCPGRNCRCECMNCMFPDDFMPDDYDYSDNDVYGPYDPDSQPYTERNVADWSNELRRDK